MITKFSKYYEDNKNDIVKRTFQEFLNKDYRTKNIEKIKKLDCVSESVIDLNGIDKFKSLKDLDCFYNYLVNLKDLNNTKIEAICCWRNDITTLEGLPDSLSFLNIRDNKLTSLKGVENLTDLVYLNCNSNNLLSLKGVENLNKLTQISCEKNPIDWTDYIDKKGNIWYIKLPKSIEWLQSDKFESIEEYWEWFEKNQPAEISRKFNF